MRYVCITIGGHYLHLPQINLWGWVLADGQGQGDDTIRAHRAGRRPGVAAVARRSLAHRQAGRQPDRPRRGRAFLEVWWPDDRVSLRARNGMFLCAEGGGGDRVSCDRREAGPWEKFFYEVPAPELIPAAPQEPDLRDRVLDQDHHGLREQSRPGVSDRVDGGGRHFP